MAVITHGSSLPDGADKSDFYNLIDTATITEIVNSDISNAAAIADTKLATITTAGKVYIAALVAASMAAGDIIYYTGSAWTRLAVGSAGSVLTVSSAGTAPEWQ